MESPHRPPQISLFKLGLVLRGMQFLLLIISQALLASLKTSIEEYQELSENKMLFYDSRIVIRGVSSINLILLLGVMFLLCFVAFKVYKENREEKLNKKLRKETKAPENRSRIANIGNFCLNIFFECATLLLGFIFLVVASQLLSSKYSSDKSEYLRSCKPDVCEANEDKSFGEYRLNNMVAFMFSPLNLVFEIIKLLLDICTFYSENKKNRDGSEDETLRESYLHNPTNESAIMRLEEELPLSRRSKDFLE